LAIGGIDQQEQSMSMLRTTLIAAIAAAAVLGQASDLEAGSKKRIHRGGEHYDTVMANYIRRCTDLDAQFNRALATRSDAPQLADAVALYQQGAANCSSGARLRGIRELTEAIRMIGARPRVSL
jgi:hypothetical protein